MSRRLLFILSTVLSVYRVGGFLFGGDSVCYERLGCFSAKGAFAKPSNWPIPAVTPESPDEIDTKFFLYTREDKKYGSQIDAKEVLLTKQSFIHFKGNRPTKLICHGFVDDINIVRWLHDMKDELLIQGDYNVIIVDWHKGNLPPYTQAMANTRVVGAQMSLLIKQLMIDFKSKAGLFHIIGHSLGAHAAGYTGERIPGMARISGLDPAGPYFEGMDKEVKLDPTDANFVDIIHSDDADLLSLGFGIKEPDGDVDFYPNLGHDQPGCKKDVTSIILRAFNKGVTEAVACNHLRSIKFYTESINSKCDFKSFPCRSAEDFQANKCHSCQSGECAVMGFHADKHKPKHEKNIRFFTTTAKQAPYCQYHLDVKIKMVSSSEATDEQGTIQLRMHGAKGKSNWIHLNNDPINFRPGMTFERSVGVPHNFGNVKSVELRWHHKAPLLNVFKWNIFGLRNPKLYLHEVDIIREEEGKEVHFCAADDNGIESDKIESMFHRC